MQKLQYHSYGGLVVPVGLILGLASGAALPDGWAIFSDADGLFLKGTDSDAAVTTTGTRSSLTASTGTGGSHSGSSAAQHIMAGYYSYANTDNGSVMPSGSSVGGHSGHSVPITYRPRSARALLIRASEATKVPLHSIMFGTAASSQSPYALFNDELECPLSAGATGVVSETRSASTSSSKSYSHSHWYGDTKQKAGVEGCYTSASASGPSHTHSGGTPTISHNLRRAVVRAFEIIDETKIEGLIGMWAGVGVPTGWELVASFVGCYLVFSSTGTGAVSGDNTVTVSGSVGNSSHSHFGGWNSFAACSPLHHSNSLSHNHSYNSSLSYEPERYNIKFIRCMG